MDKEADVVGLGAVLFELLSFSDDQPFSDDDIEYPDCFRPDACDLIGKMLERNPSRRIALEDVTDHPWMVRNLVESGGAEVVDHRRFSSVRHRLQKLLQKKTILSLHPLVVGVLASSASSVWMHKRDHLYSLTQGIGVAFVVAACDALVRVLREKNALIAKLQRKHTKADRQLQIALRLLNEGLTCPIAFDTMKDRVTLWPSNQTYDRELICRSLLQYPDLDPATGVRYKQKLQYTDDLRTRNHLIQVKGKRAFQRYDDAYFAKEYDSKWREFIGGQEQEH